MTRTKTKSIAIEGKDTRKQRWGKENGRYKGAQDPKNWGRDCPYCGKAITYTNYEAARKAKRKNSGCGCIRRNTWACYNKKACEVFEEINKVMGWSGQHAENRGEKRVLSYWVDYYEPNLNLVIEYDELHHNRQVEEDQIRQEEIEQELNCTFIRIPDGEDWKIYVGSL